MFLIQISSVDNNTFLGKDDCWHGRKFAVEYRTFDEAKKVADAYNASQTSKPSKWRTTATVVSK